MIFTNYTHTTLSSYVFPVLYTNEIEPRNHRLLGNYAISPILYIDFSAYLSGTEEMRVADAVVVHNELVDAVDVRNAEFRDEFAS